MCRRDSVAAVALGIAPLRDGMQWVTRSTRPTLTTRCEIRLSEVVRSVFYAPQYVALELGFFKDEGLDIELSTAWGADKGAAALISGSVDIGFFGPEAAVYVYRQGASDPFDRLCPADVERRFVFDGSPSCGRL